MSARAWDPPRAIHLDQRGRLVLGLPAGARMLQRRPFAYQRLDGQRHRIAVRYVIDGRTLRLRLPAYLPRTATTTWHMR
jgi:hypothetical protein